MNARPPALIAGGNPQTLSVARSLAELGIEVYGVGVGRELRWSRAFREVVPLPAGANDEAGRTRWLLGPEGARFAGAVLLAGDDVALAAIARNREAMARRFRLDVSDPDAQLDMLNKHATYEIATKAGVPTPRYWTVSGLAEARERAGEFTYPLLIKPTVSHEYQARFPGKFRCARDREELTVQLAAMEHAGIDCMLVEKVPGPDSELCSWFSYLDGSGEPRFHFTKRVVRRFPPGQGFGCYHVTDRVPEVGELGLRLVREAGLRGLANVEFKRDPRDGELKLMECNARFVATNALVASAGVDLAKLVYLSVLGEPVRWPTGFRTGLRLWHPVDDARAMLALRRTGELRPVDWLRSVAHRQTLPIMRLRDPGPALVRGWGRVRRAATGRVRRVV